MVTSLSILRVEEYPTWRIRYIRAFGTRGTFPRSQIRSFPKRGVPKPAGGQYARRIEARIFVFLIFGAYLAWQGLSENPVSDCDEGSVRTTWVSCDLQQRRGTCETSVVCSTVFLFWFLIVNVYVNLRDLRESINRWYRCNLCESVRESSRFVIDRPHVN